MREREGGERERGREGGGERERGRGGGGGREGQNITMSRILANVS